jgi:sulfide:quinone oxidoreductase
MKRLLILGGGFAGIAAARTMRQLRPDDEVVLVDRRSHFMVGFRKTWGLLGLSPLEMGQRPLAALARQGIRVVLGNVEAIDPAGRAAEVDGRRLEADALLVALGARLAPEGVPGLAEHAFNVYDPEAIPEANAALERFAGGRVAVGVFGPVYKCPPAPYEMALLLAEYFAGRSVRAEIELFTPLPSSMPLLGSAGCMVIEGRLMARGITFLANRKATAVEADGVVFEDERRPYDLVLGIAPHRCPEVVVAAGLAEGGGWVRVDRRTMETGFPGVFAAGDVTEVAMANGKPLPKAGVFAEGEGETVARRVAAGFAGRPAEATFDGAGGCYLEVGDGEAMVVEGAFLAEPAPAVRLTEASGAYREQKERFEQERLSAWFG